MALSAPQDLKQYHSTAQALGETSVNADGMLVIDGFENLLMLIKQFPWPVTTPQGEIERPGLLGMVMAKPQQLKTYQQGPMTMIETQSGMVQTFLEQVVARNRGVFQGRVFEGTPTRFVRGYRLLDCFFVSDNPDRDQENRATLTTISGTMHYHFYGDKIAGNVAVL